MNKKEIRQLFLKKRIQLSASEFAVKNQQLFNWFKSIDLEKVIFLHIYLPMLEKNEPDTRLIIGWIKSAHPSICLVYPLADFSNHTLKHFADNEKLKVQENSYGITEPTSGDLVDADKIDLVVVPLLAFDKNGYRAGYGKGFYDRFLLQCKPGTRFIGLSFFEPVAKIDDVDSHDVKLHQCITPDKVWCFENT